MTAIEAARQHAAQLHDQTVSGGADPWLPLEMARALARSEGVTIVAVPKDDPRLWSGRAVWVPAPDRFIFHEATQNDFEDAFLIAHELGHALLTEAPESHVATEVDIARVAEQPEIGVERVGDYSRRERREVTMDLFAREFLIPRGRLRSLHIASRMSARDISQRIGAPYQAVAQQLLDALLLPVPELGETTPPIERPLNPSQADAAQHQGSALLLEAGPGTGKTKTLVARVRHLIDRNVDPENILVLTFSNRAAGELVDRISEISRTAAAAMWIGTFHSFGLDLVRRFSDRLGRPSEPRLLDTSEAVMLMEREFLQLDFEHYRDLKDPTRTIADLLRGVSRSKDEVVGPSRYRDLAQDMAGGPDSVVRAKAIEVARFYEAYERVKLAANAVDFGDLVTLPVRLVEEFPDIAATLRARHIHILVDEYQDVNHASVRLLKGLAGDGRNLWVVGDARQSIYRFRGASSANMAIFARLFPDFQSMPLAVNYRSSEEIVDTFQDFGADMGMLGSAPSIARLRANEGPSGVRPELKVCGNGDDELSAIVDTICQLRQDGFSWRDQAVLCKGNDRVAEIGRELERRNVPVLFLGVLFERPEIRDLLSLLSLVQDRFGGALVRLATTPEFAMPIGDVMRVVERLKAKAGEGPGWKPVSRDHLGPQAVTALDRLDRIFDAADPNGSPWDLIVRALLEETDLARRLATSEGPADRSRAIAVWQFLNFARLPSTLGSGTWTQRFLDRIRKLVLLSDERDLRRLPAAADSIDAVRLMTIHGAKGLEFPVVHVPGLTRRGWPGPNQSLACPPPPGVIVEHDASDDAPSFDEPACLFFVALSRPRRRLMMYRASRERGTRSRAQNPTLYLDPLSGRYEETTVPSSGLEVGAANLAGPTIQWADQLSLLDYKLDLYARCPRRFLYTHVLQLGGRRTETDYMKMHQAVRQAVDASCKAALSGQTRPDEFDAIFESSWASEGPQSVGDADPYRMVGRRLFDAFFALIEDMGFGEVPELRVFSERMTILANATFAERSASGQIHLHRVETSKVYKTSHEDLSAFVLHEAFARHEGGGRVTLFHMTGPTATPVAFDPAGAAAGREKLHATIGNIMEGAFQPSPHRNCPRCPQYFLCGPIAEGDWPVTLDDAA